MQSYQKLSLLLRSITVDKKSNGRVLVLSASNSKGVLLEEFPGDVVKIEFISTSLNETVTALLREIKGQRFDMVFILGLSTLQAVKGALCASYRCLKEQGVAFIEDTGQSESTLDWLKRIKSNGVISALYLEKPLRRNLDVSLDEFSLNSESQCGFFSIVRGCDKKYRELEPVIGLSISSFSNETTRPPRYSVIEKCLESVCVTTPEDVYKSIIVDGPPQDEHLKLLQQYEKQFEIVYKEDNGGVAKAKNSGIRFLMNKQVDLGFLIDDDVEFYSGWVDAYYNMIENMNLGHVAAFIPEQYYPRKMWHKKGLRFFSNQGIKLLKHRGHHGCFLSFTPQLIEKIGYFKVFPGKFGLEHWNFTYRALQVDQYGYVMDLADSSEYLKHIGHAENYKYGRFVQDDHTATSREYRQKEVDKSRNENADIFDVTYAPLIE